MTGYGKVVGGKFMNATISPNQKGELALQIGGMAAFKRRPTLTGETVAKWEEIVSESRGGAAGTVGKFARTALPGLAGKAASAAIESARASVHTVRVDWVDGNQSLIQLPDKLFRHLAILLEDYQVKAARSADISPASGVIEQLTTFAGAVRAQQPNVTEQIAKLAALRDEGILTEEEFTTKKGELLDRI